MTASKMDEQTSSFWRLRPARRLKRRSLIGSAMAGGLGLAAMSCGKSNSRGGSSSQRSGNAKPVASQPKPGGTLRFLARGAPASLNVFTTSYTGGEVLFSVYDLLVSPDYSSPDIDWRTTDKLLPTLAVNWEQPEDQVYTFSLRRNAKWHDGTPFTAADVVHTFQYLQDPQNAAPQRGELVTLDKAEATDDSTVRVQLKRRDVHFLHNLSLDVQIAAQHVIQRGDTYERVAIGTGPFKIESSNFQKETDQVRNPDYWQSGKPYLDRLIVQFGLDQAGEMAGFIAKQLDLIQPADQVTVDTLKRQVPDAQVAHFVQNLGPNFAPNIATVPAFKDVRVRRALHLAMNRQQIDQVLSGGHGLLNPPGVWGLSPFAIPQEQLLAMPGYRKDKQQDLADAKALLAAAGFGSGLSTSVIYQSDLTTTPKVVEVVAENLRSVGVTLNLKPLPSANYITAYGRGDYEITAAMVGNRGEPSYWQSWLHSGGGFNKGRVNDPDLDRLIDAETQELDDAKRKQIWLDIQRILLDQVYLLAVPEQANFAMWQSRVHNYHYGRSANLETHGIENAWVES